MKRDDIVDMYGEELLFMEPHYFDKAIIGVVTQFNNVVVCYDKNKVLALLVNKEGLTEDEAIEYFEYNIIGAWMGEMTPAFLEKV